MEIKDKNGVRYLVFSDPTQTFWNVVEPDSRNIVAHLFLENKKDRVRFLNVKSNFRRRGIASALYSFLEKEIKLELKVAKHASKEAKAFRQAYEKAKIPDPLES